jgi:hypothetical protein
MILQTHEYPFAVSLYRPALLTVEAGLILPAQVRN